MSDVSEDTLYEKRGYLDNHHVWHEWLVSIYLYVCIFTLCSITGVTPVFHTYLIRVYCAGNDSSQGIQSSCGWWALGALIYEMVAGYPPFRHKNRKKLHHKILNEKRREAPGLGKSSMFQVKGVQAIKKQAFFKGLNWGLLSKKRCSQQFYPIL
ncbi:hypothetical protein PsorP6_003460 [Peronosclerospora sorghi]|uniref:Uncharacterized protein n=1 Tax=Peronosclerospora sorghi TaxID=230839 RepID=A0ACC0VQ53_9STRA|nr:hypothetical protein PsorP6_003460 [Peronosclerospora sorghi]